MANLALKEGANLPVGLRAKKALEVFGQTNSGVAALREFVFPSVSSGFETGGGGGWNWLSQAPRDFAYDKVNAYNSSIVMACINWIEGGFKEATPVVRKFNKDGVESAISNHRFVKFLLNPNPFYNFTKLIPATLISYYLDGNAYWFKERADGGLGSTRALYYIPHYQITPKGKGGSYIEYYDYNVNGKTYRIERNRIVHLRNGLDPYNPLSGRKILHPVLSEIFTDEEAARFIAALIRNTGIPGVVIAPDADKVEVTPEDAEALKENFKRKFGGDNRGDVLVMNFAAKVTQMGFNPEQMQFKEVRRLPEERTCSQFRIAPVVAGLGAGLDKSTYNNYEQAERHSYRSCLIPAWNEIAEEIESQLFWEFTGGDRDYTFNFDYSNIEALQESKNDKTARIRGLWTTDLVLRSEARGELGLEIDDSRDNIFFSETRPKAALPGNSTVDSKAKALPVNAQYLLKAGETEDNLNSAFEMSQEAEVKAAINGMEEELANFYQELGNEARKEAEANLDRYSPVAEAERIALTILKALGVTLLLRAVWGKMGKSVEEETVTTVSLRLGLGSAEFWDEDAQTNSKAALLGLARSYESALGEQTKRAIQIALQGAEDGQSVAQIAKSIKSYVSGREMYPGIFEEAYKASKTAGATDEEATRNGEAKARRYRAKLIAETESRTYQNLTSLEGFSKAGLDKVKVTDGDGCGWKNHNDKDKAHNTVRAIADAKRHTLAHPNCKRRFYPVKK